MLEDGLLDTSNYAPTHHLYSTAYKARLGCIKDEGAGKLFKEWMLMSSKCYSMLTTEEHEHKRAKGIQRCVVANELHHGDYKAIYDSCILSSSSSPQPKEAIREVRRFRSHLHNVDTIQQQKRALSIFEDKRAWTSLNKSVAYGHYSLTNPPPPKRARIE